MSHKPCTLSDVAVDGGGRRKIRGKRYIIFALFVMLSLVPGIAGAGGPSAGTASPVTVFERYPSSLGMSAASFGVVGLSWKRWFGATGIELTAGGSWTPTNVYGSLYWYSALVGISRRLYAEDFSDYFSGGLYLVAIAGHAGEEGWEYDSGTSEYVRFPYTPYLFAGAGLGIETVFFRHFSQEIQFLYTGRFLNDPGIDFGVNMAFRYRY
jgi:hypothetical protein